MSVMLLVPAGPCGPLRAPTLQANVKVAQLHPESSKVDLIRRLVGMCISRGSRRSLMSLKVDLDRGLSVCIIHVVVDGA